MGLRENMKEKIKALRAKTLGAGCTEAEALAAAALAAKLMAGCGLHESDIYMAEESAKEATSRPTWRFAMAGHIADCTNTAVVYRKDYFGSEMIFFGKEPGPEIALYLRDICLRAVKTEVALFKAGTFYRRRRSLRGKRDANADFITAMVGRLGQRLRELFRSTRNDRALAEARQALARRFPDAKDAALPEREQRYREASAAGWNAGGNAALNHGVTSPAEPRRIGRA